MEAHGATVLWDVGLVQTAGTSAVRSCTSELLPWPDASLFSMLSMPKPAPEAGMWNDVSCSRRITCCRYLAGKAQLLYPEPENVFPCDIIDSEACKPPTSYH